MIHRGLEVYWGGLQGAESFLVPYAYSRWIIEEQDKLTTLGVERPDAVNSTSVSGQRRYAQAYNEFFERYQGECELPKILYRSAGIGIDWFGSRKTERSLYEFLYENKDYYPTWVFTHTENSNSWGI